MGKGRDSPLLLAFSCSTLKNYHNLDMSAFVILLWDDRWIWVSRCFLSLILYVKVYVPVVSMAMFCLFVQQIFVS